jgi:hypothetical protein
VNRFAVWLGALSAMLLIGIAAAWVYNQLGQR